MADLVASGVVLAATYGGFCALALRQRKHALAVLGGALGPGSRRRLAWLGALLLCAGFGLSLYVKGPSFGSLFGAFSLTLAALALTFTLAYRPTWLRLPARLLGLAAHT